MCISYLYFGLVFFDSIGWFEWWVILSWLSGLLSHCFLWFHWLHFYFLVLSQFEAGKMQKIFFLIQPWKKSWTMSFLSGVFLTIFVSLIAISTALIFDIISSLQCKERTILLVLIGILVISITGFIFSISHLACQQKPNSSQNSISIGKRVKNVDN